MIETEQPTARKPWPDYRAVWRWHFYAGLFCIPFIIVLAMQRVDLPFQTADRVVDRPPLRQSCDQGPSRQRRRPDSRRPRGRSRFDT